jgi:uncharacterized membrane protein YphA (DoxX/SURF4 family)
MSTTQEDVSKLQEEVKGLEVMQAGQTATIAGAQTAQAAAHAATWSTIVAGAVSLVVGIFLAIGIIRAARN